MLGLAPILHITNLRTKKDKQCALGSKFSLCCLLKTHVIGSRKDGRIFFFFFLKLKSHKQQGTRIGKNMVCPGNPESSRLHGVYQETGWHPVGLCTGL